MPRLSNEEIKAGFFHDEMDVRSFVLHFYDRQEKSDTTIMPLAITAFERFDHDKAFRFCHGISDLAQTAETVRWALNVVQRFSSKGKFERFHSALGRLLVKADPHLVAPLQEKILAIDGLPDSERRLLIHSCRLIALDEAQLWQELVAFGVRWQKVRTIDKVPFREGKAIAEELARRNVTIPDKLMAVLACHDQEIYTPAEVWLEPLLIHLVGLLRCEPAIPHLIARFRINDDLSPGEAARALARIGTPEVGRQLLAAYNDPRVQAFSCEVIERWKSDESLAVGLQLLQRKHHDEMHRQFMAFALCTLLAPEANEAVYRYYGGQLEKNEARGDFLWSCKLLGLAYPELPAMQAAEEAMYARMDTIDMSRFLSPPAVPEAPEAPVPVPPRPVPMPPSLPIRVGPAPQVSPKTTGRNDPCPCRSGKKFKNCCLRS